MRCDVLIVGSSPICIAEAIYQVSLGKKVALCENKKLGGSWKFIDALGFKNIELGPHVLNGEYNGKKAMKLFGIKLQPAKLWFYDMRKKKLYKDILSAELYKEKIFFWSNRIFENKINLIKLCYNIVKYFYIKFFAKKEHVFYFKCGTFELINNLTNHKLWSQVYLINDLCQDISLAKQKRDIVVKFKSHEQIFVDKIICTLGSDLNFSKIYSNFANSDKFDIRQNSFESTQVLLQMKGCEKEINFTNFLYDDEIYIGNQNFLKEKSIKYINDITSYVENVNNISLKKENIKILALAVDPKKYYDKNLSIDYEKLCADLKSLDLINSEAEIQKGHVEYFQGNIVDISELEKIHKCTNGKIEVIKSDNLLNSFASRYKIWKRTLKKSL